MKSEWEKLEASLGIERLDVTPVNGKICIRGVVKDEARFDEMRGYLIGKELDVSGESYVIQVAERSGTEFTIRGYPGTAEIKVGAMQLYYGGLSDGSIDDFYIPPKVIADLEETAAMLTSADEVVEDALNKEEVGELIAKPHKKQFGEHLQLLAPPPVMTYPVGIGQNITPGDVLAMTPDGTVRKANPNDPSVIGVAVGPSKDYQVPVQEVDMDSTILEVPKPSFVTETSVGDPFEDWSELEEGCAPIEEHPDYDEMVRRELIEPTKPKTRPKAKKVLGQSKRKIT